jgi:hypothetical protein
MNIIVVAFMRTDQPVQREVGPHSHLNLIHSPWFFSFTQQGELVLFANATLLLVQHGPHTCRLSF